MKAGDLIVVGKATTFFFAGFLGESVAASFENQDTVSRQSEPRGYGSATRSATDDHIIIDPGMVSIPDKTAV